MTFDTALIRERLRRVTPIVACSEVREVLGPVIRAQLFAAAVGDMVTIAAPRGAPDRLAQVVGFSRELTILAAFDGCAAILPGARIRHLGSAPQLELSPRMLGTAVDALGRTVARFSEPDPRFDGLMPLSTALSSVAPAPFSRRPIREILPTGVRALDGFLTLGKGQRLAILAEPGVGKSSLIGAVARHTSADVNVIGLIGERGREVQEFIEEALSPETRARSVVVVSTSDESPLARAGAAAVAQRTAEYFRDGGLDVLLQIDSLTRYMRALREIGLAAGEQAVRRGYPPSVFVELPKLVERAGAAAHGSITALYTILTSSGPDEDPMIEELKGLTDGHVVLSKQLADLGHFPAIDIVSSLSRLQRKLLPPERLEILSRLRSAYAHYEQEREMLALGSKADPSLERDAALAKRLKPELLQRLDERSELGVTLRRLEAVWNGG